MFFYCWRIKRKAQPENALRCAFLYGDFTIISYIYDLRKADAGKRPSAPHALPTRVRRAPGNPRRGFPTIKQSAGLFYLPSCAFIRKRFRPVPQGDQRRRLWIGPPLKRRAKFYFRAGRLQKLLLFRPTGIFIKADTGSKKSRQSRTAYTIHCALARAARSACPAARGGLYDLLDTDSGQ